jgi:CDP-glucose 4,6-dehydratase
MSAGPYRNATVFVTGATGLVGASLVRRLLGLGARVHALVLPVPEPESDLVRSGMLARIDRHTGTLEDPSVVGAAVAAARPQYVFHLGAQALVGVARADPVQTFETNVRGTWALLEACRRLAEPPVVAVASSDKAYGTTDKLPYVETDPLAGSEPYEASKAITDILAQTYGRTYGLPTRIARCGNIYGPGDWNWSRIVPGTIRSLHRGERPVLRSDGTPIRDYVHVDDVVSGYLAMAAAEGRAPGEAFNFSSGERRTVREVVDLVTAAVGSNLEPIVLNEAKGEIPVQYLDSTKARRMLGWAPERRLAESLPEVVDWYRRLLG